MIGHIQILSPLIKKKKKKSKEKRGLCSFSLKKLYFASTCTRYFIYFVGAICDIAFDRFLITLPSPYECMPLRLKTPISRGSLQENQGELLIENFFSIFTHLYIFVAFWDFLYRCLFIYNITYLSIYFVIVCWVERNK